MKRAGSKGPGPSFCLLVAAWAGTFNFVEATLSLRRSQSVISAGGALAASGGLLAGKESDVSSRELRLEQVVMFQKEAMLQQQHALEGLVLQQQQMATKESTLEEEVQSLRVNGSTRRAVDRADPHLDIGGVKSAIFMTRITLYQELIGGAIYMATMVLLGACYGACCTYKYESLRRSPNYSGDDFSFGICDWTRYMCDPDWRICFFSCCCGPIRWADTVSSAKVGFLNFWLAILVYSLLVVIAGIQLFGFILVLVLLVISRQTIRAKYGLPHHSCDTICQDCCVWTCCGPCATMQEALQVEFVDVSVDARALQGMDVNALQYPPQQRAMPGGFPVGGSGISAGSPDSLQMR